MKNLYSTLLVFVLLSILTLETKKSYAQPGTLDASFGTNGIVTTAIGSNHDDGRSVAIQSDGKIVVAGYSYNGTNNDFALVRYNADGSLDNTFDTDGKVTTAIGSGYDYGYSVAIQSDGKIVVAGWSYNGTNTDFALVRYNTDGSLDSTFDTDGKVTTAIGSGDGYGASVAIQSDGKIVVAGESFNGSNVDFALVRYNTDGILDNTFDTDGKVTTAIGSGSDIGYSVAIQSDGKIVVAGESSNVTSYDFAVARYNTNGSLDNTFDTDGKVTTAIGSNDDYGYSVAIQSDGKIVVAGYSSYGANYYFAGVRYNTDGSLDNTFDTDGKITTAIGSSSDVGQSVAIQSDGKIVVAGYSYNDADDDVALARYNTDGSLNNTFDTDGKVTTAIGSSDDYGYSVAIQSDGKIVVVGYSNNGANNDFAVVRYLGGCVSVTTSQTNISCNSGSDGTASATGKNGTSPYSYKWSNNNTTQTISSLTAGTYTVTITDGANCIVANSITINEPDSLVLFISSTDESAVGAADGNANATAAGGTAPYSFKWSNGGIISAISNLTAGIYSVIVTDANGCLASDTISVGVGETIQDFYGYGNISVFPNPTDNILTIRYPEYISITLIEIYNSLGEEMLYHKASKTKNGQIDLNLKGCEEGIYYLRITTKENVVSKRVVLIKGNKN